MLYITKEGQGHEIDLWPIVVHSIDLIGIVGELKVNEWNIIIMNESTHSLNSMPGARQIDYIFRWWNKLFTSIPLHLGEQVRFSASVLSAL